MAKKIEGLEIVSRNAQDGTATYSYNGVHIKKIVRKSYRGVLGQKVAAGTVYSIKFTQYRNAAESNVPVSCGTFKNVRLSDAVAEIQKALDENATVENGCLIFGIQFRVKVGA